MCLITGLHGICNNTCKLYTHRILHTICYAENSLDNGLRSIFKGHMQWELCARHSSFSRQRYLDHSLEILHFEFLSAKAMATGFLSHAHILRVRGKYKLHCVWKSGVSSGAAVCSWA